MSRPTRRLAPVVLLGALLGILLASAPVGAAEPPDLRTSARQLLDRTEPALVLVRITSKVSFGTGDTGSDLNVEVPGTVIDPSGLTVFSDAMSDPMGIQGSGSAEMRARMKREIVSVAIVLADGTEIPATCLLRDSDLDLSFVRPREKPAKPMPCVTFAKPATAPALLDDVVVISSMGRAVNRQKRVTLRQVGAVVTRPRTYYIAGGIEDLFLIGSPAYNARGETLGLLVVRQGLPARGVMGLEALGLPQPVIVPAEALLDVARQAAAVK